MTSSFVENSKKKLLKHEIRDFSEILEEFKTSKDLLVFNIRIKAISEKRIICSFEKKYDLEQILISNVLSLAEII
jgi:hypothetical protein